MKAGNGNKSRKVKRVKFWRALDAGRRNSNFSLSARMQLKAFEQ